MSDVFSRPVSIIFISIISTFWKLADAARCTLVEASLLRKFVTSEKVAVSEKSKISGMSPVMDPLGAVIHSAKDRESNRLNRKPESSLFVPFASGFQRWLFLLLLQYFSSKLGIQEDK